MDRIKRGYILINDKKHFIYDGLNIIGRNKGAAVIIPDTSVSHYHSSIVVIENRHYISDINSSNGTFLDGHMLTPLKLYELNHENNILRFGLINTKYFKFVSSNTQDDLENGESNSLQYDEHIFVAGTQIYDIPKTNSQNFKKPIIHPHELELKSENKSISQSSVALSINDMPTQIMEHESDEQLTATDVKENKNPYNGENNDDTEYISINDLPTQLLIREEDDMSLLGHVDPQDTISNIIDETVVEDHNNVNDENSNESTDFLTMQPATQRFGSEAESQLFVQQLQRRVRYVISSSEEDLSNCDSQKNDSNKVTIQNTTSSGEETDIDCAQIRKKKLRKKNQPIIATDSEGDSTDAEGANVVSNPKEITQTKDDKNDDSDTDVETSCVSKMTTDTKICIENILDDSDIIQTTQQDVASVINAAKDKVEAVVESQSNNNELKNVVIDDNQEETLTDSFHLILTNTEHLEDNTDINKISAEEEQSISNEKLPPELIPTNINTNEEAFVSDSPINEIAKNKEVDEDPQTQLEVSFDDNLEQSLVDSGRPQNPLINVLKDSGSSELDDSIEDKLAKMFQTQISKEAPAPPQKGEDDIFVQPTQVVNPNDLNSLIEKDEFRKPTQKIVPKLNTSTLKEEDDDLFLKPTQIISSNTESPQNTTEHKEANEDIFEKPTQVIDDRPDINITIPTKNTNVDVVEDDLFLQPTQVLTNDLNSLIEKDVFLKPTEKIVPKLNTSTLKEKDDGLFFKPTQIISSNIEPPQNTTKHKETDEDIFLKPTQIIDDRPDINITIPTKNTNLDVVEDDVFLQPTQILTNTSETTESVTNNVTKSIENLGDDIFLLSTQVIDIKSDGPSKNMANINLRENIQQGSKDIHEATAKGTEYRDENIEKQSKKDSFSSKSEGENCNTSVKIENIYMAENTLGLKHEIIDGAEVHDINAKKNDSKEEALIMTSDNNNTAENIATATSAYVKNEGSLNKKTKPEVVITTETSKDTSEQKKTNKLVADPENRRTKRQKIENDQSEANISKIKKTSAGTTLTPPINENRILRRSRRKNSNDEQFEVAETNLQFPKLPIVQETPLQLDPQIIPIDNEQDEVNSHTSVNSDDDFVDIHRQRPIRTRRPGKQTSLVINDQAISTGSRMKRKSPEIEAGSSKIVSEDQINGSSVQSPPTPIKKRKVQQRVSKAKKLSIAKKESEPENTEVKKEPVISVRNESNVNSIPTEPSTSSTCSETIDNKIRTSSRRKNKNIVHATDKNTGDTNPNNVHRHEKNTKENNNDRELSDKKAEKEIQESSESSSEPTRSNASSSKTRKDTGLTRQNSITSNASTVTVNSTNSQTRKSRRRKSIANSEDDFELSNVEMRETASKVAPCTPNRNKRILKPKVVFTMLESPQLETIIRSLGGFVVDSIETSTVLLTTNVKRSQKLLSAVGLSKPICSPKWLHDSKKSNKFLDPWDYILEDKEAETKWNFSLKESLRRSGNTKLLKDYAFLIMTNTAQDVLKGSIESCGGKCVNRAPSKDQQTNFVIVASPDNKSKYSKYLKQKSPPTIIAPEAVFDGVLRQELHFENHLLT